MSIADRGCSRLRIRVRDSRPPTRVWGPPGLRKGRGIRVRRDARGTSGRAAARLTPQSERRQRDDRRRRLGTRRLAPEMERPPAVPHGPRCSPTPGSPRVPTGGLEESHDRRAAGTRA